MTALRVTYVTYKTTMIEPTITPPDTITRTVENQSITTAKTIDKLC